MTGEPMSPDPGTEEAAPEAWPMEPWMAELAWRFDFDHLRVRQKIIAIAQKYHVFDAEGRPRFFVVRPPKLALNLVLGLASGLVTILLLVLAYRLFLAHGLASVPFLFVLLIVGGNLVGLARTLLSPYRHIGVFADETESWRILTITQDNKIGLWRRYGLWDCTGAQVAVFRRNVLLSLARRSWRVETPDGRLIAIVREDSWARALMRRYLAPLLVFLILRTNFDFVLPDGRIIGKYDRLLKIRDEYLLDLGGDRERLLDRRVALAMAILLDTGEMR